jgi:hypothetical protein
MASGLSDSVFGECSSLRGEPRPGNSPRTESAIPEAVGAKRCAFDKRKLLQPQRHPRISDLLPLQPELVAHGGEGLETELLI